jgi:hypothetical protein
MLRWVVALLLLANLGFFAWTRGWLDPAFGASSLGDREPERLSHQVRPELVKLLPARRAAASSPLAAACLEAGPYADGAELHAAEEALRSAGVPAGQWKAAGADRPGVWLVYMGRFAERELLQRKQAELQRLRVPFEEVHAPAELNPGLSLGRFEDAAAAEAALAQVAQRGVRTARVVALTPPQRLHLLRVEGAAPDLQTRLQALKAPALGEGFRACAAPAAG